MKHIALFVAVALLGGCAIVDDKSAEQLAREKPAPFEPISSAADGRRVEHGIVTVTQIQPRSDIVIMPPSMQHVVWQRDETPRQSYQVVGEEGRITTEEPVIKRRRPVDDWALLEEDMNFQSEIGRVPMCKRDRPCDATEECDDLVPCERADELSCYRVKQGDYCVEKTQ